MKPIRNSPTPARAPGATSAPHVDSAETFAEGRNTKRTETADQLMSRDENEPGVDYAVPGADPSKVEKVVVETTGNFMLRDPWTGSEIPHDRPSEPLVRSTFIDAALEDGRLKLA